MESIYGSWPALLAGLIVFLPFTGVNIAGQDRLKQMPGYSRFEKMSRLITNSVKLGSVSVTWKDGGKAFEYQKEGHRYRFEIATKGITEIPSAVTNASSTNTVARRRGDRARSAEERPARGRQFTNALSPDGKWKAFYRNRNLWLSETNGSHEFAVTTGGSDAARVKYGSASWVYGEELRQTTAMWWSSNSAKIAYYRFDESQVPDYHLALGQTNIHTTLDVEPYVKVGGTNPVVDIFVYDLATKKATRMDVRDGKTNANATVGHYVYDIRWSPDGTELLFHRTNRRQNIMEFCAANPETGVCRVIVHEEWLPSWTENSPEMRFLKDGKRFIWMSERTGWKNYYLYSLTGELLSVLTDHRFEAANIVAVDETAGLMYYMARDGDNPLKLQLHRVSLAGTGDSRLTHPAYHHAVDFAPDFRHYIDIAQTHDTPPFSRLVDNEGCVVADIAKSDISRFKRLGFKTVELIEFKAADGVTGLYGMLHRPSKFNSGKKYPLLVSVYAGPETVGARETFTLPNSLTEFGFLVATFDSRSASGRGKRFLDSIYLKLGQVEMDDQAAGVKSLAKRKYVNPKRVGIFGTSYGGTSAATCLMRFPEIFHAAVANSPVTDYRSYDSIYAERYMWLPAENKEGYDRAAIMTHVGKLKGRLMLFYGTADNNVHPSNSLRLIQALQRAGKSFEVQVGPDLGHTAVNRDRMMEFFVENLVLK